MNAHKTIPKSVRIGPFRYKVLFDRKDAHESGYTGVHIGRSKEIRFDPIQSETELPQTFMHEIIHALGCAYGIDVWKNHNNDPDQGPVDQIDLMATVFLIFLRDNPELVKWMIKVS